MPHPTRHPLAAVLLVLTALVALATPAPAHAQPTFSDAKVAVTAVANRTEISPGGDAVIAVTLTHDPTWHTHTNDPVIPEGITFTAIPTEVGLNLPDGSPVTPHTAFVQWPEPHTIEWDVLGPGVEYQVFEGTITAFIPLSLSDDAQLGELTLEVTAGFQACDEGSCLPPATVKREVTLTLVESADDAAPAPDVFDDFDPSVWGDIHAGNTPADAGPNADAGSDTPATDADAQAPITFDFFIGTVTLDPASPLFLASLLGLALVGGFILNFTPCVLPVIPLKIMALTNADHSRGKALFHATVMLAGILAFWIVMGGLLAAAKLSAVGELFGYWWFSIGIGVFMVVMAVGMCGLFSMNLPNWVYTINPKQGSVQGSFGFGIMTAVLATPCTGPFLGTALGWATSQPASTIMLVFAAIGLGMGLPYLVLTAFPALVNKLPKAGEGSELLKQVMGILMLAAAAYFIGVGINAFNSTGDAATSKLFWWVVGIIVAIAGAWLILRIFKVSDSGGTRGAMTVLGVLLAVTGIALGASLSKPDRDATDTSTDAEGIPWVYFTPERLAELQTGDNILVIDFTADWCLVCKSLEKTQLEQDRVVERLSAEGIIPMKVDLTSRANTAGWSFLNDAGAASIPWLIVMTPEGEIIYQNEAYTAAAVLDAIDRAQSGAGPDDIAASH